MPGHDHGSSIKAPKVYEALRREGMSKSRAAAISNAQAGRGTARGTARSVARGTARVARSGGRRRR